MPSYATELDLGAAASLLMGHPGRRSTHAAFPSSTRPRLLVPRTNSRAAAESIRHYTVADGMRTRWALRIAAGLARLGATPLLATPITLGGSTSFLRHLGEVIGHGDLVFSVHLGPPRANRKPVLRIMDRRGREIAFAKLGINDLTNSRVRHEAAALRDVHANVRRPLVTPELITAGEWDGCAYLVMMPVDDQSSRVPDSRLRQRSAEALRAAFPVEVRTLAQAGWMRRVVEALDTASDSAESDHLRQALDRLLRNHGDRSIALGAGHGDWSRWNMSVQGSDIVAWDWERFATDVPAGWDELHFAIGAHPRGVSGALSDPLPLVRQVLPHLSADEAALVLASYLVQRGVAYLSDRQVEAGARSGPLGAWLLPALDIAVAASR